MVSIQPTVAGAIVDTLAAYGVRRIFGIPGGGSSLEIIAAAAERGIDYVLTRTETGAALMAAATAELTGVPGVVSTGLGPGAASVVNGAAYALLDRAPLLVITDSYPVSGSDHVTHQRFDQGAMFAPVTKARGRARPEDAAARVASLLDMALAAPAGSVHLDLSAADATAPSVAMAERQPAPDPALGGMIDAVRERIAAARRPVVIAGLQSRRAGARKALLDWVGQNRCPALVTYKAKGVIPDDHSCFAGLFTGGQGEAPWMKDADLVLLYGLDPVELIAGPWPVEVPVVEIAETLVRPHYVEPVATMYGPLDQAIAAVGEALSPTRWTILPRQSELPETAPRQGFLSPAQIVRAVRATAPAGARATVDAGAHILVAPRLWTASAPYDLLMSNGLSTMGYALPAAIAASLEEPDRPVIAFIGDGGIAMCLGELATAAQVKAKIIVIILNDSALSLIDVKQRQRGQPERGVHTPTAYFARAAEGLGCRAWRVGDEAALRDAMGAAADVEGPVLIDVATDPSDYRAQVEAVRGAPSPAGRT